MRKETAAIAACIVFGLVVILALKNCTSCSTKRDPMEGVDRVVKASETPQQQPPAPASPQAQPPEAKKPDAAKAQLPEQRIDVHRILGRTRVEVSKLLGKGESTDDGTVFEFGNCALDASDDARCARVTVAFDAGRAGMVSIVASKYENTGENQNAVLAWAGATNADEWNVDMDSFVQIWAPKVSERTAERKRIGEALGDYLKNIGAGSGHSRGELRTVLLVRVPFGTKCTSAVLRTYRDEFTNEIGVNLQQLGFVKLQCDLDGPTLGVR